MPIKYIRKHTKSYKYATEGILYTLRTQSNIWIQIPVGILVLVLAWCFEVDKWEWGVLILTVGLVLTAELFNTAIEAMMNAIQNKYDVDVKAAKDIAAGAVLVTVITSVVVGLMVFGPRIFPKV